MSEPWPETLASCGTTMLVQLNIDGLLSLNEIGKILQGVQTGRPAKPQRANNIVLPSSLVTFFKGWSGLAPTAHVERPLLHRGGFREHGGATRPPLTLLADFFSILPPTS